jgi:hypothetical protein
LTNIPLPKGEKDENRELRKKKVNLKEKQAKK